MSRQFLDIDFKIAAENFSKINNTLMICEYLNALRRQMWLFFDINVVLSLADTSSVAINILSYSIRRKEMSKFAKS